MGRSELKGGRGGVVGVLRRRSRKKARSQSAPSADWPTTEHDQQEGDGPQKSCGADTIMPSTRAAAASSISSQMDLAGRKIMFLGRQTGVEVDPRHQESYLDLGVGAVGCSPPAVSSLSQDPLLLSRSNLGGGGCGCSSRWFRVGGGSCLGSGSGGGRRWRQC